MNTVPGAVATVLPLDTDSDDDAITMSMLCIRCDLLYLSDLCKSCDISRDNKWSMNNPY